MKIFWSWQSDHDPDISHYFVRDALADAIKALKSESVLEEPSEAERRTQLHLDHDTKGKTGWVDITQSIFEKIENAAVFVADVTPVVVAASKLDADGKEVGKRPIMNPNVAIELGYALKALDWSKIIPVMNTAYGSVERMTNSMERRIGLQLSDFVTTPHSLRETPAVDQPAEEFVVNLADLYFHYYRDKHGRRPPNPDPSLFEHLQYLTPGQEFRLSGDGLGASTNSRRTMSNELGQAFCRLFLHDHLNVTYFAHIDRVLGRALKPAFGDLSITRCDKGDLPDYFCAEAADKIFLGEAKGRHEAISFSNKVFQEWRNQFKRVEIRSGGVALSVKGYIVATRFATQAKPYTKSTVYAEDPFTPGDRRLDGERSLPLGNVVIGLHYAELAQKLNQPILAEALEVGFVVPDEILIPTIVWELRMGPLAGTRFVGGYYPSVDGVPRVFAEDDKIRFVEPDPFRLDIRHATFVGVEEKIFKQIVAFARGRQGVVGIQRFEQLQPFYSAISILRDGSVIGPLEFFLPVANPTF